MTMRGHIKNGTVVLDQPVGLPDGMDVEVEVRPLAAREESGPTWGEVFRDLARLGGGTAGRHGRELRPLH